MADYNGDLRLVKHELAQLNVSVDEIKENTENSKLRLNQAELQSALQAQTMETICKKVESLDDDVKKISLVSKVIGGIAGGLAVIAAAIGISK